MALYDVAGVSRLGTVDPKTGRAYEFTFPHSTNDPAEIRLLRAAGGVEVPEPKEPEEPEDQEDYK